MARSILVSYVERDSYIHKLNPLTKLFVLACVVALAFFLNYIENLIIFTFIIILARYSKVLNFVFRPVRYLIILFVLLFGIQSVFYPYRQVPLYTIPIINLTIWADGIEFAANISARLLVIAVYGFLFVLTTHPGDLVNALRKIKLPYKVGYIILATLHLIPTMQIQTETIIDAQKSRGLDVTGNIIKRLKGFIPLVGPLFMGSIQQAVERSMALEARAFSAECEKTSFRQTIFRKRDRNIIIASALLTIIIGVSLWIL